MYSHFPDEFIEEVRTNNDIVDVIAEYVRLEKKGMNYFGLCPFHKEKTPSFSVAPGKQIYYCFGCGKGGNVIHFIMEIEKLDFLESVKLLAERVKIPMPEDEGGEAAEKSRIKHEVAEINKEAARYFFRCLASRAGERARDYLKSRSITEQTARKFGLGYSSEEWDGLYKHLKGQGISEAGIIKSGLVLNKKNGGFYDRFRGRLMFPIFDLRGTVIGFGGRVLDNTLPKYVNSPETALYSKGKNLYALNFAKNSEEKRLVVVEGYMDAISLHQADITNAVASLGTALTENQGRLLRKYTEEIVIAYDADTAGQAATIRGLDLLNNMGCQVRVLSVPDGKDPDDYVRKNGGEAFKKLIAGSVSLIEYKAAMLRKQIDTSDTNGKIHFLNKAAEMLARIENNVEREMYVKNIAREYGITEDAINAEIMKKSRPATGSRLKKTKNSHPGSAMGSDMMKGLDDKLVYDERFILCLLCIENGIYKNIKDIIQIDSFTDPENRRIAAVVLERLENGRGMETGELLNMVDSSLSGQLSKIISDESHCDDILKAVLGKIKNMEIYRAEKRLKEISELLKNEDSLDKGDVEKLRREFTSLAVCIKRQKSI